MKVMWAYHKQERILYVLSLAPGTCADGGRVKQQEVMCIVQGCWYSGNRGREEGVNKRKRERRQTNGQDERDRKGS